MHPELYAACVDISGGIGMTMSTETMVQELDSDPFPQQIPAVLYLLWPQ